MATPTRGTRTGRLVDLWTALRVGLIGLFTGVETVALVAWLALVADAPLVSRAAAVGLAVLVGGLLVEHVITDLAVNGPNLSLPFGKVVLVSASEALLWVGWLAIAERVAGLRGSLVAGAVLAVLLVPQHSVEDNVLRGRGAFSSVLTSGTVGFSVLEAASGTAWLLLVTRDAALEARLADLGLPGVDVAVVGVAVLAVGLFFEHVVGVAFARR